MDKASVSDTGDCRFKSCQGRAKTFQQNPFSIYESYICTNLNWLRIGRLNPSPFSLFAFDRKKWMQSRLYQGISCSDVSMLQYNLPGQLESLCPSLYYSKICLLLYMWHCHDKIEWKMQWNSKIIIKKHWGSTGIWTRDLLHPKQESYH